MKKWREKKKSNSNDSHMQIEIVNFTQCEVTSIHTLNRITIFCMISQEMRFKKWLWCVGFFPLLLHSFFSIAIAIAIIIIVVRSFFPCYVRFSYLLHARFSLAVSSLLFNHNYTFNTPKKPVYTHELVWLFHENWTQTTIRSL